MGAPGSLVIPNFETHHDFRFQSLVFGGVPFRVSISTNHSGQMSGDDKAGIEDVAWFFKKTTPGLVGWCWLVGWNPFHKALISWGFCLWWRTWVAVDLWGSHGYFPEVFNSKSPLKFMMIGRWPLSFGAQKAYFQWQTVKLPEFKWWVFVRCLSPPGAQDGGGFIHFLGGDSKWAASFIFDIMICRIVS